MKGKLIGALLLAVSSLWATADTTAPRLKMLANFYRNNDGYWVKFYGRGIDLESGVVKTRVWANVGHDVRVVDTVTVDSDVIDGYLYPWQVAVHQCYSCDFTVFFEATDAAGNVATRAWSRKFDQNYFLNTKAISWYHFDETTGGMAYDKIKWMHRFPVDHMYMPWAFKEVGLLFDKVTDTVRSNVYRPLFKKKEAMTTELWLKENPQVGGSDAQWLKWVDDHGNEKLKIRFKDDKVIYYRNNRSAELNGRGARGHWNRYHFVEDANSVSVFRNGLLIDKKDWSLSGATSFSPLDTGYIQIGGDNKPVKGFMGGIKFWDYDVHPVDIGDWENFHNNGKVQNVVQFEDIPNTHRVANCDLASKYYVDASDDYNEEKEKYTYETTMTFNEAGTYYFVTNGRYTGGCSEVMGQNGIDAVGINVDLGDFHHAYGEMWAKSHWTRTWYSLIGKAAFEITEDQVGQPIPLKVTADRCSELDWIGVIDEQFTFIERANTPPMPSPEPKVKVFAKDVSPYDPHWTTPRMYVKNTSQETINSYKMHYVYKEDKNVPSVQTGHMPSNLVPVRKQYTDSMGIIEIAVDESLAPGAKSYWGQGPEFAIRHQSWSQSWDRSDDPSYKGLDSGKFVETYQIPVFDNEGKLLSEWACPNSSITDIPVGDAEVRVMAKDGRYGFNWSTYPNFYVENVGETSIKKFEVRYYFRADEKAETPGIGLYYNPEAQYELVQWAPSEYYMSFKYNRFLHPNEKTDDGVGIGVETFWPGWITYWDRTDDHSYQGMTSSWAPTDKIVVLAEDGTVLWGQLPAGAPLPQFSQAPIQQKSNSGYAMEVK